MFKFLPPKLLLYRCTVYDPLELHPVWRSAVLTQFPTGTVDFGADENQLWLCRIIPVRWIFDRPNSARAVMPWQLLLTGTVHFGACPKTFRLRHVRRKAHQVESIVTCHKHCRVVAWKSPGSARQQGRRPRMKRVSLVSVWCQSGVSPARAPCRLRKGGPCFDPSAI